MSLYDFSNVAPGVFQISEAGLDMQYLVIGSQRALLIDTGTGIGNLRKEVECRLNTDYDVVITHIHNDHFGGSGAFRTVYVPENDYRNIDKVTAETRLDYVKRMISAGAVSGELLEEIHISDYPDHSYCRILENGHIFDLGDRKLEVIGVPGHTDGEIALVDKENNIVFSGDSANPIMLLKMEGEDRNAIIRLWHEALCRLMEFTDSRTVICGGHGMLSIAVFNALERAAADYLDGKISTVRKQVHLYKGQFIEGDNVVIFPGFKEDL